MDIRISGFDGHPQLGYPDIRSGYDVSYPPPENCESRFSTSRPAMGGDCPAIAKEAKEARFSACDRQNMSRRNLSACDLYKSKGGAWWWKQVEIVQILNADGLWIDLKLQCTCCQTKIGIANPAISASDHFDAASRTCRKAQNQKRAMDDALGSSTVDLNGETETASNSSMPMAKRQAHSRPALQSFVCTAGQQDAFNKHLGRFFYRNNVALHLVEDHALKSAAATVGVTPPTRRVLSGPMLDTEFNLCKADVKKL
eukprot:351291-Chlamydomonas_euryale.AAC.1